MVSVETKDSIRIVYRDLNPVELKRKINECQSRLIRVAAPIRASSELVKVRRKKEIKHTVPIWRREAIAANPNPFLERQKIEELRRASVKIDGLRDV